jgi:uncharacterized protein YjcR
MSQEELPQVQELISQLQAKGWTLAAIADELGVAYRTIASWRANTHQPANPKLVEDRLAQLLARKRIPKGRRYGQGQRYLKGGQK